MVSKEINIFENSPSYSNTSSALIRRNQKKLFFTVIFTLYLSLTLIRYLWPANLFLTSTVTLLGLLSLIVLSLKIPKDNLPIYKFTGMLATSFLVSSFFVYRTDRIGHVLLFIFLNFGIALILLRRRVYSQGAYLIFYTLTSYITLLILTGVDPNEALEVVSRNGISEMMIVASVSLYIIQKNEGKEIDLMPAFITLLISIWGIGRSGIISSFVLFIGLLIIKMRIRNYYFYALLLMLSFVFLYLDKLLMFGINNVFFGPAIEFYFVRKLEIGPDSRVALWANYFNNLDFFRFVVGANVLTDPWPDGAIHAYNYHNMFIHLHLQTGLMAIVVYIFIILALAKFWKTNNVFFVLLLTICLRGMTDTFLLFESWDFILYYFIYYFLKDDNLLIKADQ
jgi:hypothetical protein